MCSSSRPWVLPLRVSLSWHASLRALGVPRTGRGCRRMGAGPPDTRGARADGLGPVVSSSRDPRSTRSTGGGAVTWMRAAAAVRRSLSKAAVESVTSRPLSAVLTASKRSGVARRRSTAAQKTSRKNKKGGEQKEKKEKTPTTQLPASVHGASAPNRPPVSSRVPRRCDCGAFQTLPSRRPCVSVSPGSCGRCSSCRACVRPRVPRVRALEEL